MALYGLILSHSPYGHLIVVIDRQTVKLDQTAPSEAVFTLSGLNIHGKYDRMITIITVKWQISNLPPVTVNLESSMDYVNSGFLHYFRKQLKFSRLLSYLPKSHQIGRNGN